MVYPRCERPGPRETGNHTPHVESSGSGASFFFLLSLLTGLQRLIGGGAVVSGFGIRVEELGGSLDLRHIMCSDCFHMRVVQAGLRLGLGILTLHTQLHLGTLSLSGFLR